MKTVLLTLLAAATLSLTTLAADPIAAPLQNGLMEEEVNRNLEDALRAYRLAVEAFDAQRPAAAAALYRMGECYRKLGRTNEALAQYRRVLAQFADQTALADLCRTNLASLAPEAPAAMRAPALSATAERQVRLLEEELALVEQQLAAKRRLVEDGRGSRDELVALQRESLALQRQMAEVESKYRIDLLEISVPTAVSPPAADPTVVATLREELQLLENELAATRANHRAGVVDANEVTNARRELLKVQRELAALNHQPPTATPTSASTPSNSDTGSLAASERDEIARLGELLRNSPDLLNASGQRSTPDQPGRTPLQNAAAKGQVGVVRFLIESGADINGMGDDGLAPLHHAAWQGHKAVVELLLAKGANANGGSRPPVTPLHLAALGGHRAVIQTLLTAKPDLDLAASSLPGPYAPRIEKGYTALHLAVQRAALPVIEMLLAAGANPNQPQATAAAWTPLYLACADSPREIAEALIRGKADVNAGAGDGRTPLHRAADNKRIDLIELLLASNADPNKPDSKGWTPTHTAAVSQSPETVAALLKASPDVNRLSRDNTTPLHLALGARGPKDVNLLIAGHLLEAGASVDLPVPSIGSPLHLAIARGSPELVAAILTRKPKLEVADPEGYTPLQRAVLAESVDIARALLSAGADPNVAWPQDGNRPLHWAVRLGNAALIELLLEFKANPNVLDLANNTPLSFATDTARSQPSGIPGRPGSNSRPATATELVDILRRAGADEFFHLRHTLSVRRPTGISEIVFTRQNSEVNRFTLLEVIAKLYGVSETAPPSGPALDRWDYPDLTRITLLRRTQDGVTEIPVDLAAILDSGDPTRDVPLEWGDTIEIPEADHPLNTLWNGFSVRQLETFARRLSRSVTITVKGETTTVTLTVTNSASLKRYGGLKAVPVFCPSPDAFWLAGAVEASRMIRTSSDLRHVRVNRKDPKNGQSQTMIFDLETPKIPARPGFATFWRGSDTLRPIPTRQLHTAAPPPAPTTPTSDAVPARKEHSQPSPAASTAPLWLQDGDAIEIPERQD